MDETHAEANQTQSASILPKNYTFFGSYDHSLDPKGRIIIPNAYRKPLGEVFTISITRDGEGIALYPDPVFDELLAELYHLNQRKPAVQKYQAYLAKMSYRGMEADGQGRLLLPLKLRQMVLGDARDVEISGALDHIRIVDRKTADDEDSFFREHREALLDEIGNMMEE